MGGGGLKCLFHRALSPPRPCRRLRHSASLQPLDKSNSHTGGCNLKASFFFFFVVVLIYSDGIFRPRRERRDLPNVRIQCSRLPLLTRNLIEKAMTSGHGQLEKRCQLVSAKVEFMPLSCDLLKPLAGF